ncbi:MAG: hypothetical protein QMD50_02390 [Patescibacteria group bacterium]|nr:hypothetical protein [Patescibacteria group bacterium]
MSFLKQKGFIAIITSVIVTAIVTVIALTLSGSNFIGRFNAANFETKDLSREIAKGCLEFARLKLASGAYAGNETTTISSYACHIFPIETTATATLIKANAVIDNKESDLMLTVNKTTFKTIFLEELSSF